MGWKRVRPDRRGLLFRIAAVALVLLIGSVLVDARVRPMIRTLAANQAQIIAVEGINQVIEEVMAEESVNYQSLVTLEKDASGRVTSIQTDIVRMNSLKAKINNRIAQMLEEVDKRQIKIPIGSISGSNMLLGRGPNLNFYLSLSGHANTAIQNVFDDAGINQTRHQIMLEISTSIYIIIPGYHTATQVDTNMCIAETVIVGMVPEVYAGIQTGLDEIPQK